MVNKSVQIPLLIAGTFAEIARLCSYIKGVRKSPSARRQNVLALFGDARLRRERGERPIYDSGMISDNKNIRSDELKRLLKRHEATQVIEKGSPRDRGRPKLQFEITRRLSGVNPLLVFSELGLDRKDFDVLAKFLSEYEIDREIMEALGNEYLDNFAETQRWLRQVRENRAKRGLLNVKYFDPESTRIELQRPQFRERALAAFREVSIPESTRKYNETELTMALYAWDFVAFAAVSSFARIHRCNTNEVERIVGEEYDKRLLQTG